MSALNYNNLVMLNAVKHLLTEGHVRQ